MEEEMSWDADELGYGYVLCRVKDGGWWHAHFGRSPYEYDCELLGRRTGIFSLVQKFLKGARPAPPKYFLTLDGEGVEGVDLELDCWWGKKDSRHQEDSGLADEARHFQTEIMPLLHVSEGNQNALREIIRNGRYLRQIEAGKLRRIQ
jgi:hypothetical protein